MALGIKTNATYLNVRNGKLYRYSKTKEEGTTTILNKKGEEKYYFIYDYIEGYITKMSTRTENLLGIDKLFLSVQFVDGTETYYINMDVDSKYFEAFCCIIPNANLARPLRMVPNQKEVDGKMKSSLFLVQDSQMVKWFYTKDNPQGRPEVDVTLNKKGEVVDYDREARNKFYFNMLQELNSQLLNPSMLPEVSQVTSTKKETAPQSLTRGVFGFPLISKTMTKIKNTNLAAEMATAFKKKPDVFPHMEHAYSKDTQIIRQSCLKAAAQCAGTSNASDVIKIAEQFEQWVLR